MSKLKELILKHKWNYAFALLAMIISISLDMLAPQLTRHVIDDVVVGGRQKLLTSLLLGFLTIGIGRCVFQYVKEFTCDATGSKIASELRKDLFHHIQGLSANFFDKNNTGELMARVGDDVNKIWDVLSYIGMLLAEVAIHTLIVLYCMYSLSWKLAILPTIGMAAAALVAIAMEHRLGAVYEAISEENAQLNNVAEENLAGVRTVKSFAREKHEIKKFLSHNQRYYDLNMQQSRVFVKYYPYLQVITRLLPFLVLLPGGYLVIQDQLTLGELSAFVEYSTNIVWPMEMLGWLTNGFSAALASNRRINKIYAEEPAIKEPEQPVILPDIKGSIEFSHVSFAKEDGYEILHDVSFSVEAGKTIGIMGATGAGKTSIINLLDRLYDVTKGSITMDGVDIRKLRLEQLRKSISFVMQDVFLFSDTISENVKLGKKETLQFSAIQKAAHAAQADGFIERMDKQYETIIGERGVGLSGGQKQRISIARALSKKSPILVFDDSTSALDMETESMIQESLSGLNGTTKIIIAHRISAVKEADEIIVLENGSIAERGTHASLLEQKGLYYETYMAQYGEYLGGDRNVG